MKTSPLAKACSLALIAFFLSAFACSPANALGSKKLGEYHAHEEITMSDDDLEKQAPYLDRAIRLYQTHLISKQQFINYIRKADIKNL